MAKDMCVICGKEMGWFSDSVPLSDGYVCSNCLYNSGIYKIDDSIHLTASALKEYIERRTPVVSSFSPTKEISNYLRIDENNESFKIGRDIFEYSNLLSFELLEDGDSVAKGGLGRAMVGGLLFGGVGAVVGGVTGRKKNKNICNSMRLRVTLKNAHVNTVYIDFITSKTKTSGFIYRGAQTCAQSCISALEIILDQNQRNASISESAQGFSAADEIMKFKQLLDEGVISQEEFEEKKQQLLGL